MDEITFLKHLDDADKDLDAFPFWRIFKKACAENPIKGIKKMTQADITIASNGIAGPRNENYSKIKDGTVFLSWNIHDKIIKTKRFNIEGARNEVIDKTVFTALSMCLMYLKNELRKEG